MFDKLTSGEYKNLVQAIGRARHTWAVAYYYHDGCNSDTYHTVVDMLKEMSEAENWLFDMR